MNFDFSETAGLSQSNVVKPLEGNKIHTVIFDGCEARDFAGQQDPSKTFRVLEVKFHNDEGVFTHTIWEPREEDAQDQPNPWGGMRPARLTEMKYLIKHLIDAVNPDLGKKIDKKEASLTAQNWVALRNVIIEATNPGKGTETKIKLVKNNKGEAMFPYFLNYSRDGKLYMSTNFIGNGVFFTTKELDKIKKSETKPVEIDTTPSLDTPKQENTDFDLDI